MLTAKILILKFYQKFLFSFLFREFVLQFIIAWPKFNSNAKVKKKKKKIILSLLNNWDLKIVEKSWVVFSTFYLYFGKKFKYMLKKKNWI